MENLSNVLEAILFVVGRSVSVNEFKETLGVNAVDIENALKGLEQKYANNSGLSLVKVKDEYQLVSNKAYFEYITKFVEHSKKENLSNTCMEVLSIIAYNPKITKSEIESIRGVNSDSQVSKLLEYGLVEEVGRMNAPGRPAMFSVTNEFLKCMGINKVEDLPDFNSIKTEEEELTLFKNIEVEDKKEQKEEQMAEEKEEALV
ncbi:MAG: SMC-Scp complex subunit ScpB [Clostridia bacterium]|nr:SMC-Scp complex subunit ScpB [Clostridia bacterium]